MLDTFLATLSPMLVMLICIAVGFVLRKTNAAPENTASVLSRLELNALLPALILKTFLTYCTVESITGQYKMVLYGLVASALSVGMGILVAKVFAKEKNAYKIYRYALAIANYSFLGNAIVPAIMGEEAMYAYMLFTIPLNIVNYSWAVNSLIPEGKAPAKKGWRTLLNPICIALLAGIVLGFLDVGKIMPDFVSSALSNLAGCMGPVAMLLTGFVIGGHNISNLLKNKKVYIVALLRLIVLPTVIVAVLWLLGADNSVLFMGMFAFSTALGLNTVIVPAAHGGDTRVGASMAMISHMGAMVTIPLLYAVLTTLLGGIG